MNTLLVSTQSYRNDVPTEYGYLLKIQKDTGQIKALVKIDTPVSHCNPDERIKPGLRGISIFNNDIYVASWDRIHVFDRVSFKKKQTLTHSWLADLHGIHVDRDGIWVTSSLPDAVILYDFECTPITALWLPETPLYGQKETVDKSIDWRLKGKDFRGFKEFHANHVAVSGPFVFITGRGRGNTGGRMIKIDKKWFTRHHHVPDNEIQLFASHLHGPHDGFWDRETVWVTETHGTTIAQLDLNGKVKRRKKALLPQEEQISYDNFKDFIADQVKIKLLKRPGKRVMPWTRGLAIDRDAIYIGQSTRAGDENLKARIVRMDKRSYKCTGSFDLDIADYPETRIFQLYSI